MTAMILSNQVLSQFISSIIKVCNIKDKKIKHKIKKIYLNLEDYTVLENNIHDIYYLFQMIKQEEHIKLEKYDAPIIKVKKMFDLLICLSHKIWKKFIKMLNNYISSILITNIISNKNRIIINTLNFITRILSKHNLNCIEDMFITTKETVYFMKYTFMINRDPICHNVKKFYKTYKKYKNKLNKKLAELVEICFVYLEYINSDRSIQYKDMPNYLLKIFMFVKKEHMKILFILLLKYYKKYCKYFLKYLLDLNAFKTFNEKYVYELDKFKPNVQSNELIILQPTNPKKQTSDVTINKPIVVNTEINNCDEQLIDLLNSKIDIINQILTSSL